MMNVAFVVILAFGLLALIAWGVNTLPEERWQMLAAVPVTNYGDGSWRGLNLTFYGFFSATGTTFGLAIMLVLLASVGLATVTAFALAFLILLICVPASRLVAAAVERKRNTFTIAGAAFVATIVLPLLLLVAHPLASRFFHRDIPILPTLASTVIAYVLAESIGRLACLSFGCCYGMPVIDANPRLARLFQKHNLIVRGSTKKAAYASGLAGEPLIPVQAITSVLFATSGVVGIGLYLAHQFRLAALIPALVSWVWRACSESLRADHRGTSYISAYQVMAIISAVYLIIFLLLVPSSDAVVPSLVAAFSQLFSAPVVLLLQFIWVGLFLYYGRSRVTESTLSFRVVADRI
jgi:hypothetical protein